MKRSDFNRLVVGAQRDGISSYAVGAVIAKGDSVLIVRRRIDDFLGGHYEIPGGGC